MASLVASCGVEDSSLTGATQNEDDAQCGEEEDDDDEPHFFDPPPKEYECPICFRVLREPNIVSCCGIKVCGPCITRVENSCQPCPKCRQPFTKMLEKELQRKILGLRVRCRHYGGGCEWEGELRDMYKHIDVKKGACEFVAVKCPFGCPGSYQRREASNHEAICTNLPPELHIKRTMRVTEEFKEEFQATLAQFQELCKSESARVEELTAQCRAGAEQLESVLQSFNEKRVEVDKTVGDIIKKLQTTFFVEQQEKLQQLFEEMLSKERKEQQKKIQQLKKEHEIKLAETEHQFEDKKKRQIKDLQRECREESKKQMTALMTSLRGEFAQEMSQLKRRCEEEHQQQMASLKEQFEKKERERSEALKKQYDAEHQKQLADLKKYYEKELKEKYEDKVKQQMENLEVEYYTQREKQIETLQQQYYTDKEQQLDTLKEQYAASRQRMSTEIRQLYENEHKQRMKECKEQCIKEHEKMKKEYHNESQQQLKEAKAIFRAEKDKIVEELRDSLTAEKEELKVKFKEECEEVKLEAKPVPTGVTSSDSSIAIHTSPASVSSFKNEPSPPGLCGLSNSGNTSFMNSALQCLGNTKPLAEYFIGKGGQEKPYKKHINRDNPSGMGGVIAEVFGSLLEEIWNGQNSYVVPRQFNEVIQRHAPQFSGHEQQDSVKLLEFLLDGLHKDLNLIKKKPYVDMGIETEGRDDEDIAKETWHKYLLRNQSVIVRLFQGQLKSTLHCPKCKKVSRIFDPFMYLSLPLLDQNTRFVEVYLVRADPTVCVMKYHLKVPKNGWILHMKEQMQKVTNIDPSNLVVLDVYHSRFHRVYYDKDPISDIMERDDIYIYELRKPLGDQDWVPVPVYMREIQNLHFGQKQVTTFVQVFGLPVVVTVSRKGCTYRTLYDTIMSQITRFVSEVPKAGDLFNLVIVNSHGSQEVQKLKDNKEMLKLTSSSYIGCNWEHKTINKCYNMKEAKLYEEHDSCTATKEPKKPITVYECMDLFVQKEVLGKEDTWYCPTCKKLVQASKKFDLWKMPEVLVIHLKRFSYSRNKIESRIEFPLQDLNLSKYVVNEEEPHPLYDLFAVSNHYGGLGGGHYTAYAKNKDNGKWYSFDDGHVSEVSSDSICSSLSYVLFYQRKTEGGTHRPEPLNRFLSVSFDEVVKGGNKWLQKKQQSN